jgi:hypothetical protein
VDAAAVNLASLKIQTALKCGVTEQGLRIVADGVSFGLISSGEGATTKFFRARIAEGDLESPTTGHLLGREWQDSILHNSVIELFYRDLEEH